LQSRFLAHLAHRFRITDVVLSLWGGGVSALGKFPGGGRFVCRGACTGGKRAPSAPGRGFAASGGCETRRTVVRQPGPEPRFGCARDAVTRLRGGSLGVPGGCRPGR